MSEFWADVCQTARKSEDKHNETQCCRSTPMPVPADYDQQNSDQYNDQTRPCDRKVQRASRGCQAVIFHNS